VRWPAPGDTLGVVQTGRPPTLLRAVDAALKGALVDLVELRVADGLGGKAVATLWGELPDVEAAIALSDGAAAHGHAVATRRPSSRGRRRGGAGAQPDVTLLQEWRG